MSNSDDSKISRSHEQWARFRFSVIGPLLAAPAAPGQLQEKLQALAQREWRHPISGQQVRFGLSTLQRWYYTALNHPQDPLTALRRKIRSDYGCHASLSAKLAEALTLQFRQHPSWSYQLHAGTVSKV